MTKSKGEAQLERFKEAACELGADDDEAVFNAKLRKMVKQKALTRGPVSDSNDGGDGS